MIASAVSKVAQAQSELDSHYAHVRSTEAAADSARQKIAQAQAGVAQAQATLSGASATQGYSEIQAQTDGVVTQRVISPGVLVNPGQTILRVAQISPIRLQANVTEGDLARVRVGSRVQVVKQGENAAPLTASVTSVAPSVDSRLAHGHRRSRGSEQGRSLSARSVRHAGHLHGQRQRHTADPDTRPPLPHAPLRRRDFHAVRSFRLGGGRAARSGRAIHGA